MKTICLVMIVKDEAKIIRRCLESVRPIINHWIICDTGSNDSTKEIIAKELSGLPGNLFSDSWVDFASNRTLALERARGKADYHLLLDADMTVKVQGDFQEKLSADAFLLRYEGPCDYWVERLASDKHHWRYVGATHEYLVSDEPFTRAKLEEISICHHEDGGGRGTKDARDLGLLKKDFDKNPNDSRTIFYMAQGYRDIGNLTQAIEWYENRATMGGWEEEVWFSLFQIARLQHRLGYMWAMVLNSYLNAYQFRPTRLEPLYYVARFYRENQQFDLALLFSRKILESKYPDDLLFIERAIYEYGLLQEYACSCEAVGMKAEARRIRELILANPQTPESVRESLKI